MGNTEGIEKIFSLKQRPEKPLALYFAEVEEIFQVIVADPLVEQLVAAFLPGPLTIIAASAIELPERLIMDGKVGIRVPDHDLTQKLIKAFGEPMAATSANLSGCGCTADFATIPKELLTGADLLIDGGDLGENVESTVIEVTDRGIRLLREGAISMENILKITTEIVK
jgi:L-threonylcarbamoyladenylate synthase